MHMRNYLILCVQDMEHSLNEKKKRKLILLYIDYNVND